MKSERYLEKLTTTINKVATSMLYKILFLKKPLLLLLLQVVSISVWAQITPTNPVPQGKVETYYFNDGTNYIYPEWTAVNGTVLSSVIDGTLHSAVIRWSNTATQGTIYLRDFIGEEGAPVYVGIANLSVSLYNCSISPPIVSTYSKCGLGAIELTATPGNGGDNIHWFNQYGQSQIVSLNYTTPSLNSYSTYTFYATSVRSSDGCESSPPTPVTVTVKQIPTAAVSRPSQEICSGTVINPISLSNPNGVAGTTYSWTFQDPSGLVGGGSAGTGSLISQTLSVAGSAPATVTYSVVPLAGGCNGSAVTSTVTVNPSATTPTITGNKRFGPGSLTVVAGASGIYNWYDASGIEINGWHAPNFNTIDFSESEAIYSNYLAVEKVSDKGCKSAKVNVDIHIKRLPTISSSANRLPENGSPITITAEAGYDTYSWMKDGNIIGNYTNTLSTNQPGVYKVRVTLSGTSDYGDSPTVKILDPYTGLISGSTAILTNTPAAYSFKAEYTLTDPEWRLSDGTYLGEGTSSNGYYYFTVNFPVTGNKSLRIQERLENESGVYYNVLDTKAIVVNPCPAIVPGAVLSPGATHCQNGVPVNLTMTSPSGGNGSYTYQWMQSVDGLSWVNANGASTNASYTAPVASITMYYKRVATSCANTVSEGVIVLSPPAVAGTVFGSRENYGPVSGSVYVSGHQGAIEKWQKRELDGGWQDLLVANSNLTYNNIGNDTRFRARIISGVCPVLETNEVLLKIYPLPQMQTNGPATIAPGEKTNLQVVNDYSTYQWYRNDVLIPGATGKILSVSKPGSYKLTVRAAGASFSFTAPSVTISEKNSLNQNFVKTTDFTKPGIAVNTDVYELQQSDYTINTSYFDGLGRPIQSVALGAASDGGDVVQPIAYDALGREAKKYLPYAHSARDGRYQPTALADQSTFYANGNNQHAQDPSPYSETIFEPSPLNRVIKQGAPGAAWQPDASHSYASTDHTVKFAYEFNEANEVFLFKYDAVSGLVTKLAGADAYYAANQLYANRTKDEQNNEVIEYVDKVGRTVCKKVQYGADGSGKLYASTYYLYDDFGNLVVVLPPEAVKNLTN